MKSLSVLWCLWLKSILKKGHQTSHIPALHSPCQNSSCSCCWKCINNLLCSMCSVLQHSVMLVTLPVHHYHITKLWEVCCYRNSPVGQAHRGWDRLTNKYLHNYSFPADGEWLLFLPPPSLHSVFFQSTLKVDMEAVPFRDHYGEKQL